jgi:hypothetical protein
MHSLFLVSTSLLESVCYLAKEIINAKIRVDQKKWSVSFQTYKQKKIKNELIFKKCYLNACFYTKNPAF